MVRRYRKDCDSAKYHCVKKYHCLKSEKPSKAIIKRNHEIIAASLKSEAHDVSVSNIIIHTDNQQLNSKGNRSQESPCRFL